MVLSSIVSTTVEAGSDATSSKLREDLRAVFNVLPKDVQQLMLMNPERAALVRQEGAGLFNDLLQDYFRKESLSIEAVQVD
ncbi:hypothetical protein T459_10825 [Capsicum annuum]|uniref:Uncharacterized protein n=1 Tax=Capsicum annuum TaxID=4072 RepID=A0A2G3A3A3_CAPAN|nr:hypothetical protein T459_10825 [Capsicum annuum]